MTRRRGALLFSAALLMPILAGAARAPCPAAEPERLINAAKLRPFFQALTALEQHRAQTPARILQIGDSHTANDSLSGRLRELLQARFGSAGRGWLPAGVPYKYFQPRLVTASEAGWRHLRPSDPDDKPVLGFDAVLAKAIEPEARMTLVGSDTEGFDRVAVQFIAQPGGQPLSIRVDQNPPVRIQTAALKAAVRRFELSLPRPGHQVELTASGTGTEILGWAVERRRGGVIYENHGSIGAAVKLLEKLSPEAVSFELADRKPVLLVIAFGTNEGFRDGLDLADYAERFRGAVSALARRARGAAVLVLGPPDGNRRAGECSGEASCRPSGAAANDNCAWTVPPKLAEVGAVQKRVAMRQSWAFWDWSAAMGGACAIDQWLHYDPPLAMPDHVHLSKAGYALAAERLFADLMRAYDESKRVRRR